MNSPANYLSPAFPSREQIKRAAFIDAQIAAMRSRNLPVPPNLVREAQHAMATFRNLPPHEQEMVSRVFNADIATLVERTHVEVQEREADAVQQRTDALTRELTQGMAGRPQGLTLAQAAALRAGDRPKLRVNKLPTGRAADERVQAATGMTLAEYSKKLDDLLVTRNMKFYTDPKAYEREVEKAFPGQSFDAADALVKGWQNERVGLELRRRAEANTPDSVTMRKLDPNESRRMAIIEAAAKHSDADSIFAKTQTDRLKEIRSEGERDGKLDVRAAIADAFLKHGGTLEVEAGPIRTDSTDEIIGLEDDDNG